MTEQINLPPLPEPFDNDRYIDTSKGETWNTGAELVRVDLFDAQQMGDYARAAILADRAARDKDAERVILSRANEGWLWLEVKSGEARNPVREYATFIREKP